MSEDTCGAFACSHAFSFAGNRDVEEGLGSTFPSVLLTREQLTEVNGKKVINGFDFGPCIILNGEVVEVNPRSIVHPHKSQSWNAAQRICLAQVAPCITVLWLSPITA